MRDHNLNAARCKILFTNLRRYNFYAHMEFALLYKMERAPRLSNCVEITTRQYFINKLRTLEVIALISKIREDKKFPIEIFHRIENDLGIPPSSILEIKKEVGTKHTAYAIFIKPSLKWLRNPLSFCLFLNLCRSLSLNQIFDINKIRLLRAFSRGQGKDVSTFYKRLVESKKFNAAFFKKYYRKRGDRISNSLLIDNLNYITNWTQDTNPGKDLVTCAGAVFQL